MKSGMVINKLLIRIAATAPGKEAFLIQNVESTFQTKKLIKEIRKILDAVFLSLLNLTIRYSIRNKGIKAKNIRKKEYLKGGQEK
jgi:hypothetical protein